MRNSGEWKTLGGLLLALVAAFLLVAWVGRAPKPMRQVGNKAAPKVLVDQAYQQEGGLLVLTAPPDGQLYVAHGADGHFQLHGSDEGIRLAADHVGAARLLATPISLTWRHPLAGSPVAQIIRVAGEERNGRTEPRLHTFLFQRHGDLPVLSLVLPTGALLDADTGLLVVGNGIFHAPKKVLVAEARDPRWWKYPGNFHMRGKSWERSGRLQFILPDGSTGFESAVGVRVNGQMTRAFPQHALRLNFSEPLAYDLFGEEVGTGYDALVLRAAGNDQIKAMMRDVFQHELCAGLPFATTGHRTCVVYINGAYWGVHHLRHRMDEDEMARRLGVRKKHITMLEDEARLYHGDTAEVARFEDLAMRTARWDGVSAAWKDTLHARLDVDGFLHYMATQMILGNMDWPNQNVRFWRYSGKARTEGPLDGRWRFIMGDSDLGFGAQGAPQGDMFMRALAMDVPITRLFWGMLHSAELKARFVNICTALVQGPFSAANAAARLERIVSLMAPEMERHTARWRKPQDVAAWQAHIAVLRKFAAERPAAVIAQLKTFQDKP